MGDIRRGKEPGQPSSQRKVKNQYVLVLFGPHRLRRCQVSSETVLSPSEEHPSGGCCHCFLFINWGLIQLPLKTVGFFLLVYSGWDRTSSGWKPATATGACLPELNLVQSSSLGMCSLLLVLLNQLQFLQSWKASHYKNQNLGKYGRTSMALWCWATGQPLLPGAQASQPALVRVGVVSGSDAATGTAQRKALLRIALRSRILHFWGGWPP